MVILFGRGDNLMCKKHLLILMGVLLIVETVGGCSRRQGGTISIMATELDTERFRSIKLEPYWSYDLRLDPGEKLTQVWLVGKSIYCLTNENVLRRLDRESGVTRWTRRPAEPPRLIREPVEADGKVLVVAHNIAMVYQISTGAFLKKVDLPFMANSDPAFDGEVIYIADSADRVVAINLESGLEVWSCRAEKAICTRPVQAGTTLISVSSSGEVMAYSKLSHRLVWAEHFRTWGKILTPPVVTPDGRCYVAGGESMLYCLSIGNGEQLWKYFAGALLPESPAVADGRVYLYVPHKGMVVLNAKSGAELENFHYERGRQYLGRVQDRVYMVSEDRKIICADADSGQELGRLLMKDYDFFLTNDEAGCILVANRLGRIVCLERLRARPQGLANMGGAK